MWEWLFFVFLPLQTNGGGLFSLELELCRAERPAIFYQERLRDDKTLAFVALHECREENPEKRGKNGRQWTVVACKSGSHLDLHFNGLPPTQILRAAVKTGRLAICEEDGYSATDPSRAAGRLRLHPNCSHYEPLPTDAVRVYLLCDQRLEPTSPLHLLLVASRFSAADNRHQVDAVFWGFNFALFFVALASVVYFIVRNETRHKRLSRRETAKSKS